MPPLRPNTDLPTQPQTLKYKYEYKYKYKDNDDDQVVVKIRQVSAPPDGRMPPAVQSPDRPMPQLQPGTFLHQFIAWQSGLDTFLHLLIAW